MPRLHRTRTRLLVWATLLVVSLLSSGSQELTSSTTTSDQAWVGQALSKTVLAPNVPTAKSTFSVSPDGKRTFFPDDQAYSVFDEQGDFVRRMPIRGAGRGLALLPNGQYLSAEAGFSGHISLLSADGIERKVLVTQGAWPELLRHDMTGWTSPRGLALDALHQLFFVLDTSAASPGAPDPASSRVAVYDTTGNYIRSFAVFDSAQMPASDEHRTWYDDVEVDAAHSLIYVTARATRELQVFDYDGSPHGRVPGIAGIAVLPGGRIAVGDPDEHHIRVYAPTLRSMTTLSAERVVDLEADDAGRLYATVADPTILYWRWPADLATPTPIRPRFTRITVRIANDQVSATAPFRARVAIASRPALPDDRWHAFARPSDGSDTQWRELQTTYQHGTLTAAPNSGMVGLYDVAVHYGAGPISKTQSAQDLLVEKTITFADGDSGPTANIRPSSNRFAFRQGEPIPVWISFSLRGSATTARIALRREGASLASFSLEGSRNGSFEIPGLLTSRLLPGHYSLAIDGDVTSRPYDFDVASAEADSPIQRILYHEFDQSPATAPQFDSGSLPDQLRFIRDYVDQVAALGFTRETDRRGLALADAPFSGTWRLNSSAPQTQHDIVPTPGSNWQPEYYLDRATANGVSYDTQILTHCSGVRLADSWFPPIQGNLQRLTQWFGKYPAFYGFNYNDEIFFNNAPFTDSSPADAEWLNDAAKKDPSRPIADLYRAGLTHMYARFDSAVKEVRPDIARTATPMWQYPAVEGSYAPTVYANMTEVYSHYLSEGYSWPWYPAHSADMLRRPGLPLMGVFESSQGPNDGEAYIKDAMQMLGRGVQGIGVEHTRPFRSARAANALRVTNELARMYGPIFAECTPDNEATILYSFTQDITEKRDTMGTPHWERVLALYGAGLMAGLPMNVSYEEDLLAGKLLDHGKPRVPLLFLAGQTVALPPGVVDAMRAFASAGGKIVVDPDSRAFAGAVRFPLPLLGPALATHNAINNDALFPKSQPAYEEIANALRTQFGPTRRLSVDTDDPWISKNRFEAGAIRYVLLANETSPYPLAAPDVWSLGALYNRSILPKRIRVTVPGGKVVYDVFDRRLVQPDTHDAQASFEADLTTFPSKLYALAPHALTAPRTTAALGEREVKISVKVGVAARVPLQLAVHDQSGSVLTLYRGTSLKGELSVAIPRPISATSLRLEVTELLGGKTSLLELPASGPSEALLRPMPEVDIEREPQIRALLAASRTEIPITGLDLLPPADGAVLVDALRSQGRHITTSPNISSLSTAPVSIELAATVRPGLSGLLLSANSRGLFGQELGTIHPGTGRGFISAAFAPRTYGRNLIAIVGGDQGGLAAATRRFAAIFGQQQSVTPANAAPASSFTSTVVGVATAPAPIPLLSERVGARLSGIQAMDRMLVVSASGYSNNLARVDDKGDHGVVVTVARAADSPKTTSLFISRDGRYYGLAGRSVERLGERFTLIGPSTVPDGFSSFGNTPPFQHTFSASADAAVVLAPGPNGVVAWRRSGSQWRESWADDYWKKFDDLDWSLTDDAARVPSFETLVPARGELALITFGEFTNTGWLQNRMGARAKVYARNLESGSLRWTFDVPGADIPIFPKLFSNGDGSLVLLQAQLGTAASASHRFYVLQSGQQKGTWATASGADSAAVSEHSNRIAIAYGDGSRLLEVREPDGTIAYSQTWPTQPLATVFAEDGTSIFVSDEGGQLSRLSLDGTLVWQVSLGCSSVLVQSGARLYAAGWDGRVRAFDAGGQEIWKLDLTPAMAAMPVAAATPAAVHQANRSSQTSSSVPNEPNLLRTGEASLSLGGTPAWGSTGKVDVLPEALTNGEFDDVNSPWLSTEELFWHATAQRKVWAEIRFKHPTDLHSLTVYENSRQPASWPTESVIQVWDDVNGRWRTAGHKSFLSGRCNTYSLRAKAISRLRYIPWGNYFHNFYTSEIEVR